MKRVLILGAAFALPALRLCAHEVRPAYLEVRQTTPQDYDLLWKVPARGDDMRLGLYVRLPEDCLQTRPVRGSFAGGAYVERWSVQRPGGLTGACIRVDGLASTMTDVLVRLERLDGTTQVSRLRPSAPSFIVEAAPDNWQVARAYAALGVEHILLGIDHLLFVLALLFLVRGWRRVVGTVTAFTVAHSITLAAATLGFVDVPGKPVEATIALSIVFVASEIVHGGRGRAGLTARWPWVVAFTFGLLHGLGFAGALTEVGLPQRAIPLALLCFNLGVELGQLVFIAAVLGLVYVLRWISAAVTSRRTVTTWRIAGVETAAAYGIGAMASFWVIERTAALWSW